MEYEKIKKLMDDMGNSKLTSLDIDFPDGTKISMKKENQQQQKIKEEINIKEEQETEEEIQNNETGKLVKSPMVGTFYIKPSPTSEPYVQIGTEVKEGDTLCIIEAMKLMNEIQSEYSGKIVEIFVEDGSPVEYGTKLFRIE